MMTRNNDDQEIVPRALRCRNAKDAATTKNETIYARIRSHNQQSTLRLHHWAMPRLRADMDWCDATPHLLDTSRPTLRPSGLSFVSTHHAAPADAGQVGVVERRGVRRHKVDAESGQRPRRRAAPRHGDEQHALGAHGEADSAEVRPPARGAETGVRAHTLPVEADNAYSDRCQRRSTR